jgi:hypothetical protein
MAPPTIDMMAEGAITQLFAQLVEAADDYQDLVELTRENLRK